MLKGGNIGIEKESLRVDEEGRAAQTKHPFGKDKKISRDFCENQVEIISGVSKGVDGVYEELNAIQRDVRKILLALPSGREYLWPFSNPPFFSADEEILIAEFDEDQREKNEYRRYLAGKYGKKLMLYSGIHFNYSFTDEFWRTLFSGADKETARTKRDAIYLDLAAKLTKNSWLLVYLFAASPVWDDSFLSPALKGCYASPRCSEIGYWNDFIPLMDYDSPDAYTRKIRGYIDEGRLISAAELYYPVRVKPKGENTLENMEREGIDHIELRMIDLNPLCELGIFKEDIRFLELFIIYLAAAEATTFCERAQVRAVENMKRAAALAEEEIMIENENGTLIHIVTAAAEVLDDMADFYREFDDDRGISANLAYQRRKLEDKSFRYAVRVRDLFGEDYQNKGFALAKRYSEIF